MTPGNHLSFGEMIAMLVATDLVSIEDVRPATKLDHQTRSARRYAAASGADVLRGLSAAAQLT
jgi:hypothetical protein